MWVNFLGVLFVWYLQFYQPMVLNSLVCSLIPVCVLVLQGTAEERRQTGIISNSVSVATTLALTAGAAVVINTVIKAGTV